MDSRWTTDKAANAELEEHGRLLLVAAEDWLKTHEPDYLEKMGRRVLVSTALQALANAEATRCNNEPAKGLPFVEALAHQVAMLVVMQADPPHVAFRGFAEIVNMKLNELMRDRVGDHTIGAVSETKGSA